MTRPVQHPRPHPRDWQANTMAARGWETPVIEAWPVRRLVLAVLAAAAAVASVRGPRR